MSVSTLTKTLALKPRPLALFALTGSSSPSLPIMLQFQRSLTTKKLSPTVAFMTKSEPTSLKGLKSPIRGPWEYRSEGRPLSILLCWLMAKNNAVNKYAQFYLDRGFDVLTVRITPTQLLIPTLSNGIVERELMPILKNVDHTKSLIHGFSVGGYVFGQMLRVANEKPEEYKGVMNAMIGQIWDSVVDVNGTSIGVSKSVFPKAALLQKMLEDYINLHMRVMYNVATKHYYVSHEHFYNKPLKAPALFLCSENDKISTMDAVQAVQDTWQNQSGIQCNMKSWKNTPHVGHMQRHPEDYKKTVEDFLTNIGFRPNQGRLVDTRKDEVFSGDYNVAG